jgi:hypothetical protein
MDSWEYLVIHINVEPPKPPPGASPAESGGGDSPAAAEGGSPRPVFSDSFLKKEFPQFYEPRSGEGATGQPQHPAQQLQTFLNGHGSLGWELIGVFPVGVLSMLFFRRPKAPSQEPAPAALPPQPETAMEAILARLEALEKRLAPVPSPAPARSLGDRPIAAGDSPVPQPGQGQRLPPAAELLNQAQLKTLASETPMPSSLASRAIGLRSATSLANHGARYGYRPGLCKTGPNGLVAIYTGLGPAQGGGKERRLWIVVSAQRLEQG